MAITAITEKAETVSTANANTYASASWTPAATKAEILCCSVSGSVLVTPTCTGNSITWTRRAEGTQSTFAVAAFSAPSGGSPSTGATTIDYTADPGTGAGIWIAEVDGADLTTPIRQMDFNSNASASAPTFTFPATTLADSAIVTFYYVSTNPPSETLPADGGGTWVEGMNNGWESPTSGMQLAYNLTPGALTTVTWGSATASSWRGLAIEIAAAAVTAASLVPPNRSFRHMIVR